MCMWFWESNPDSPQKVCNVQKSCDFNWLSLAQIMGDEQYVIYVYMLPNVYVLNVFYMCIFA